MSWTSGPAPIVVGVDGSPSSELAVDWALTRHPAGTSP